MAPLARAACFVLMLAPLVLSENHANVPGASKQGPCVCAPGWAKCESGWGEHGSSGCANLGKSCADICPGDLPWKPLYREAVEKEAEAEAECGKDPTAKWGPNTAGTSGPFAVAFAGGMRNFAVTWHSWQANLVDASGGNVDVYL